ncbi:MAG TPA: TDP-N-acetylfucosamine:lipid II N-acetylfucosaminyltransferase [Burkholderiaceae bacterium]|nr:TDP-N-acetylfucosamine:lipid II N-acetylfucosaminyltransferase [Burkholderiaceae bacterium]
MRIVHLARDEKFIPLMRELFELAFPGQNHWLIARRSRAALKFVAPGPGVQDRAEWWFRTPLIAGDVAGADAIVAHSMTTIFANAIRRAPDRARVAWLGWGYDYYPLLASQLGPALLPQTRALVGADDEAPAEKTMALTAIAPRLHSFCVLPPEVPMLRRAVPGLVAVHHELPLFTTEDVFERGAASMAGPDVLVGNSATASNNHVEAFELLHGRVDEGRVIAPLSYGNLNYGRQVAEVGTRLFGERFDPLTQWMPIDEYNRRIGGCGFVVMNHRRQQAVGNIGAALFKGATVYLRPENPLASFYRDLGIHLRSTDELAAGTAPLEPLAEAERAANRARIGAHYARARVIQAIRDLPALRA